MKRIALLVLATSLAACGAAKKDNGKLASSTTTSDEVKSTLDVEMLTPEQVQLIYRKIYRAWYEYRFDNKQEPKLVKDQSKLPKSQWHVLIGTPRVDTFAISKDGDGYLHVGLDKALGTTFSNQWEGPFRIDLGDIK